MNRPRGVGEQALALHTEIRNYGLDLNGETTCAICMNDFDENENVRLLQCGHYFHANCVDQWLERSESCPLCRQSIVGSNL